MKYLLDTNIMVYLVKQKPSQVLEKFRTFPIDELGLSTIVLSELQAGVERSSNPQKNQYALNLILRPLEIAPFDHSAAMIYGRLNTLLEKLGTPIGPFDTLIAAHALSLNITLVTNNERQFKRVPGLKTENWI